MVNKTRELFTVHLDLRDERPIPYTSVAVIKQRSRPSIVV